MAVGSDAVTHGEATWQEATGCITELNGRFLPDSVLLS